MKIQSKLLVLLLPFVLVPLLVIGWTNFAGFRDQMRASFRQEVVSSLELLAHRLGVTVHFAVASVQQLQSSRVVQSYATERDRQLRAFLLQPALLAAFLSYIRSQPDYAKIAYVNRKGEEEATIGTSRWQDLEPILNEVRRRLHPSGKPVPLLASTADEGCLLLVAAPVTAGGGIGSDLVILQVALDGIYSQMEAFATRYGMISLDGPSGASLVARGGLLSGLPEQAWELERELPELGPGFKLRVGADSSAVEGEIQASFFRTLIFTLAAILIASLLLHFVLRRLVVGPIRILTAATESIAAGELNIRLPYRSSDELGALAESVRNMAAELKDSRDRADYLAYHDHLTGLPNRRFFVSSLENAVIGATRSGKKLATLFLDLDDFKQINDVHGHEVGDQVLIECANRLRQSIRGADLISTTSLSRIGGDEFFVLLDPVEAPVDAARVAMRLLSQLKDPILVGDREHLVSASVGISIFPDDSESAEDLIRDADIAMYHAKAQGKNNHQFYSESLNRSAHRRALVAAGLRHAMERDELVLLYHPKIDLQRGRIVGAEALLRWRSRELGEVLPGEFIPVAVEIGTIQEIGAWVVRSVWAQFRKDPLREREDFRIAVNLSAAELRTGGAAEELLGIVAEGGRDAARLEIEITESEVMRSPGSYTQTLHALCSLGVKVVLDQFGTAYSSLSYLRKLPLDVLKIDRSLIGDLPQGRDTAVIVRAILSMSHELGLEIVAVGVETQAQADFLFGEGCDFAQGFHFYHPIPGDRLLDLLRAETNRP